jgi:uridine kinase
LVIRQAVDAIRRAGSAWPCSVSTAGLNLPPLRYDPARPAERFYEHAIRFDEMFTRLVVPFREARACRVQSDYAGETADAYRPHVYEFGDTDVILLEGIFLLKQALRWHYDLSFWVDCTFETALERAVRRGQEGLAPAETVRTRCTPAAA